jgi:hypothetical protein
MRPVTLYIMSAGLSAFTAAQLALSPETSPLATLVFQPDSNHLTAQVRSDSPASSPCSAPHERSATRCIDVSQLSQISQTDSIRDAADAVHTGIEGFVAIAPIDLIERLGLFRARPYKTTLTILNATGQVVTKARTDSNGYFRLNLQPGTYTLSPDATGTVRAKPQIVIVSDAGFTTIEVIYSSGI